GDRTEHTVLAREGAVSVYQQDESAARAAEAASRRGGWLRKHDNDTDFHRMEEVAGRDELLDLAARCRRPGAGGEHQQDMRVCEARSQGDWCAVQIGKRKVGGKITDFQGRGGESRHRRKPSNSGKSMRLASIPFLATFIVGHRPLS